MRDWFVAFALTQLFEMPLYFKASKSWRVGFFASAMTHPLVWFVFPLLPLPYWPMVACAEVFAVVAEAVWLRANKVPHALWWSLGANGFSFSMGLLLRETTGLV